MGDIPSNKVLKLQEYRIAKSDNLKHNSINLVESIFLFLGFSTIRIFSSDSSKISSRGIFLILIKLANCSISLVLFTWYGISVITIWYKPCIKFSISHLERIANDPLPDE